MMKRAFLLTLLSALIGHSGSALAQNFQTKNGVGRRFVWKNVYIVEQRSKATEWVYQVQVGGSWQTVASAATRDLLFKQVWFKSEQGQMPSGPSRYFERRRDSRWHFDSEHETQAAAAARRSQLVQSGYNEARIRTVLRRKSREELLRVPRDYKIVVPSRPDLIPAPGGVSRATLLRRSQRSLPKPQRIAPVTKRRLPATQQRQLPRRSKLQPPQRVRRHHRQLRSRTSRSLNAPRRR